MVKELDSAVKNSPSRHNLMRGVFWFGDGNLTTGAGVKCPMCGLGQHGVHDKIKIGKLLDASTKKKVSMTLTGKTEEKTDAAQGVTSTEEANRNTTNTDPMSLVDLVTKAEPDHPIMEMETLCPLASIHQQEMIFRPVAMFSGLFLSVHFLDSLGLSRSELHEMTVALGDDLYDLG